MTDVFSDMPGRTTLAQHEINTGNAAPVRQAPYRSPHTFRDLVREKVDRLLEEDIIEPSSSHWASPVVLVFKKNESCGEALEWSEECAASFRKLKEALVNPPVLRSPNFDLDFIVQTDASDFAIGACM